MAINGKLILKISKLKGYLKILEKKKGISKEEIHQDEILRGAVERYLYLAADTAISIAEMVIVRKGLRVSSTYSESIDILGEAGILPNKFAFEFARMAGFRNILAHEYENTDYSIIVDAINNKIADFYKFIEFIEKLV